MTTPQTEFKKFFDDITDELRKCLTSRQFNNESILKHLAKIPPVLTLLARLNWNDDIQNLVLMLKLCIVYNDPEFDTLLHEKGEYMSPTYDKNTANGLTVSTKACEILGSFSEKMMGKESYGLLYSLVEPVGELAYKFKDLFFNLDGNIRISPYIAYDKLLNLLKLVVFRAKSLLACAESRKTSEKLFDNGDVSFTSISVTMASILQELLGLGLRILTQHNFQETANLLEVDMVGYFTCEVASACPFERMDPEVFQSLSRYIIKFHMTRPKLYSRKTFTSLFNVLMKQDPELTGDMNCLLEDKQLCSDSSDVHLANSVLVDCHRSVTVWLSSANLGSPYILEHSLTAESELKLLSTLCKTKAFSDTLFRDSTTLLRLIVSILRSAPVIEKNSCNGLYGKSDAASIINVVVDASNLLCMVVKLCSQKTADESCIWHSIDDDYNFNGSLNEFVSLWYVILELMPSLIECQYSSIPIGILNAIADFGEHLFSLLRDTSLQRVIITTVLIYCSSALKSEIRAKAGRALARLIEFNCMTESLNFSMDAFDAIKMNMRAKEQTVRIAFSWAFGNWSDMYLQGYLTTDGENSISEQNQIISDFYQLITSSNDAKLKIKYNIYRGAGNLLKFVQNLNVDNTLKIKAVVYVLLDQVGKGFDFKARWNASCALRNVFTNPCLLNCLDQEVKNRTMQCFIKYMCQSENYKERIQCVVGSSCVYSRTIYGDYYMILWDKLVNAAALEPPEFFSEVGQAEKLNIEVGRAYVHLTSLLNVGDLERVEEIITAKWDGIHATIKCAVASTPLDDVNAFESAVMNLEKLMKDTLRPFELELCRTLYYALRNRSDT